MACGQCPVPMPAVQVCQQRVSIGQFHPENAKGHRFRYPAFNFEGIRSGHVMISGSVSVTKTVCSK